jgi:SOUL heme-binding protein
MQIRLLCGLLMLGLVNIAMATEEPKYSVIEKSGDIELRAYAPMVIAETLVDGTMDAATSVGFKRIADYIFGNNTARAGGSEKISMTAPVTMTPTSEKISMTAPVTMQATGGQWRMYFVMPSQYTLDALPKPNNPAVTLREVPASRVAVLRFSGLAGEEKTAKKTAELLAWIKQQQLIPKQTPQLARYNPPWTLPFLRRNEVMVTVE